jgi:hypothetical protein
MEEVIKSGWIKCPECNYTQKEKETCEYCKASLIKVIRIKELEHKIQETEEKIKGTEQEASETGTKSEKFIWIVFALFLIGSIGIRQLYVLRPKNKVTIAYETATLSRKPWEVQSAIEDLYNEWVNLAHTCKSNDTCLQVNNAFSDKVYDIIAHIGRMQRKTDNAYIQRDWKKCFQICLAFNLQIVGSNSELRETEEYRKYLDERFN